MHVLAESHLRLSVNAEDYVILAVYFLVVLGIGFAARTRVKTALDYFVAGRSLPAWVTGLAFVSANLGATEVIGQAANGAQYGAMTVHYYWVGAIPAMVFLAIFMMPFYYGSRVRSVPEFLGRRYDGSTQALNAVVFAIAQVLIAGINLYALAIVVQAMLGWPQWVSIVVAGAFVLVYITLGGLSSAIYNEVLQFFVIVVSLVPVVLLSLKKAGGWAAMKTKIDASVLGNPGLHAWRNTGFGSHNPMDASWLSIVFGLGFVLSFGYWTTNFAEIQRALSAKNMSAARRTPVIASYPKVFLPLITVLPGMLALVLVPGLGKTYQYNDAIPLLIRDVLPNGVLGLALTGLLASFMAGMAANVSSFNTVLTTDIWEPFLRPGRSDEYYVRLGRWFTVAGVAAGVGTAFIAASFSNLMNYMQTLFGFFNAPVFATFLVGLIWRRMSNAGAFCGLAAGITGAILVYILSVNHVVDLGSSLNVSFIVAAIGFAVDIVVSVLVSLVTTPVEQSRLEGLVWGSNPDPGAAAALSRAGRGSTIALGAGVLVIALILYILVF
ncbi:MAG TPA: sodium:solute symporter family protein [Streptosporangiaceae bacterium]|nr:sodium:solute symporter family protein [Streptosporangiaceae bacterium]